MMGARHGHLASKSLALPRSASARRAALPATRISFLCPPLPASAASLLLSRAWSTPTVLQTSGDQVMPWGAYDASVQLRIGYFDHSYDPANHQFGYTLASETSAGSLNFTFTQVTTTLSDPTQGDRWFSGLTVNS